MSSRPRLSRRQLFLGASSLFLARAAAAGVGLPDHLVPPKQLAFGGVIDDYYLQTAAAKDATARTRLLGERGQALRVAMDQSTEFRQWLCVRYLASSFKDGSVQFLLGVAGTRTKATIGFSSPLVDLHASTRVQSTSQLGKDLLALKDRAVFLASGSLIADDHGDFIESIGAGRRTTEIREFESPDFLVQLREAERPAWLEDLLPRIQRR